VSAADKGPDHCTSWTQAQNNVLFSNVNSITLVLLAYCYWWMKCWSIWKINSARLL